MRVTSSASRAAALVIIVVTFLAGSPPAPVGACVPAPPPAPGTSRPPPAATPTISQATAQADVVFRGHPIRREDASYTIIDSPATRTTFAIDTLWKGAPTPQVTVLTYSCGGDANPFAAPGMYIIYASKGLNGELVPLAGVSRSASASDQEDAILGPGAIPPSVVPGATPIAAVVSSPPALATTGSSGTVSAVTPVASPSASTGNLALRRQGSYAQILLIAGAIVVGAGLIVAAIVRRRP